MIVVVKTSSLISSMFYSKDLFYSILSVERKYFNNNLTDEDLVASLARSSQNSKFIHYTDSETNEFKIDIVVSLCRKFKVKHRLIPTDNSEILVVENENNKYKSLTDIELDF